MYFVGYLAYFELNIDYIIKTYCVNKEKPQLSCNGKCHLAKQLNPILEKKESNKFVVNIIESFSPLFHKEDTSLNFILKEFKLYRKQFSFYRESYNYLLDFKFFRPPIV